MSAVLDEKMKKAVESLQKDLAGLRTGRATPNLLENIRVEVYGQMMPLSGCASVTVQDARTLLVTVWDQQSVKAVDSAVRGSDLGLNPRLEGNKLFVILPELTQERRNDLAKVVKKKAEDMRVVVRNLRRDANEDIKAKKAKKELSEDDVKDQMDAVQKLTDATVAKIDQLADAKTKELMSLG